jgi:DNA-binding transcriptional MocR family regulator
VYYSTHISQWAVARALMALTACSACGLLSLLPPARPCTSDHPMPSHTQLSKRVLATDPPVIVKTKQLMARAPPSKQVMSLAQGIVHWQPPPAALEVAAQLVAAGVAGVHGYGPAEGLPALRQALKQKLEQQNGLAGVSVWAGTSRCI